MCIQSLTSGQNGLQGKLSAPQIKALHHNPPACQRWLVRGNEYGGKEMKGMEGSGKDGGDELSLFAFAKGNTITVRGVAAVGF